MKVVIQRSLNASVTVNNKIVGKIDKGLVVLVGFTNGDTINDIDYMVNKIINLRIFDDNNGKMNLSLLDINGSILSISQFTLYGSARKGRRPSFDNSLAYDQALELYKLFNSKIKLENIDLQEGIFGANMLIELVNNGPVTIILDSRE